MTEAVRGVAELEISWQNIFLHILNDIIIIEWSPQKKEEYFDVEFQRSMRLLRDGK